MKLFTPIERDNGGLELTLSDECLFLGSCFADHIGGRWLSYHLGGRSNPFGTLYNPESIRSILSLLLDSWEGHAHSCPDSSLFEVDHRWYSWLYSSRVSAESRASLMHLQDACREDLVRWASSMTVLFITFGNTAYYRLKSSGLVVSNCHKQPASLFDLQTLSVSEIVESYRVLIERLIRLRPRMKVVFTVSPFRYAKDGFHDSQLRKATLLLAIDRLQQLFPGTVCYFPAYEIMMDELRDYRFYAEDLLHPSELGLKYIWDFFVQTRVSEEVKTYMAAWDEVARGLSHRPFSPQSAAYMDFLGQIKLKVELLQKKYSNLAFENVLKEINEKIESACHTP